MLPPFPVHAKQIYATGRGQAPNAKSGTSIQLNADAVAGVAPDVDDTGEVGGDASFDSSSADAKKSPAA